MENDSKRYKRDKTAFRASSVGEEDHHYGFWKDKTLKERLEAACYLINQFYGTTPQTSVDRTVFTKRKHKNG
jgi:hypothetical protein